MDGTNRNTALASALVEELARSGVRRAALSPGSRSTPLAVALWREPAIEVSVVLDERSAGFFALGCSAATRQPAVVLCTSGSAAANLHPAVVEADEASVPLIVLTADRPPELRAIGAGQTIDQLKLYGDAVRWFSEIGTHDADDAGLMHFRSSACRAYAAAAGDPRPGPVHLNVPWREPLAPTAEPGSVRARSPLALEGRGDRPLTAVAPASLGLDPRLLDSLAARIGDTPRGLIVAGRQPDGGLGDAASALAAASGYPILAEPTSQLRRGPHDRSRIVSTYDLVARSRPEALAPDLVLRVGELPTSKPLRLWLADLPGLEQVVLDPDADWKDPTRSASSLVRADPALALSELAGRVKADADAGGIDDSWTASWLAADAAARGAIASGLASLTELSEPGAWLALGRAVADGDQVLAASSMPVRDLETFLPAGPERVRFLANRGANGIDGLVSTAAGAAAASGAPTWAVLGDLALAHDIGGLAAARATPNLRLLVLDNAGGGIFHFLPQAEALPADEFEALLGTPSGLDLAQAARLYGLTCVEPRTPEELDTALAGDARIVIVRVDRSRNLALHRLLAEDAAKAVAAA